MNDVTTREGMWRRFGGDDWACFDALPPAIRERIQEHAYDAWSVNALMLWRMFRRKRGCSASAQRSLLRYLDHCEQLELIEFANVHRREHGLPLPHEAARATVLRYRATRVAASSQTTSSMQEGLESQLKSKHRKLFYQNIL